MHTKGRDRTLSSQVFPRATSGSSATSPHRGFREIYRAHYPFVWSSLFRFGVPRDQLEDAVQETFLVAYRRQPSRQGVPLRPWLYGIARRVASNHRRAATRRWRKASAMQHATVEPLGDVEAVLHALRQLERQLGCLGERDRELFVLSEVEGLTGPELATALGTNLNTVYSRLRRLRERVALDEALPRVERLRTDRPSASARGWAMLLPLLGDPPRAVAIGTLAWWSSKVASAGAISKLLGIAAVTAGTVLLVTSGIGARVEPSHATSCSAIEQATAPAPEPVRAMPTQMLERSEPTSPAPEGTVATKPRSKVARSSREPSRPVPELDAGLARQTELLRSVATALRDARAEHAWTLLEAFDAEFPSPKLQDLRAALRIETLCARGRTAEARSETERFEARHAASPLRRRVLRSCGAGETTP